MAANLKELEESFWEGVRLPESVRAFVVDPTDNGEILVICDEEIAGLNPVDFVEKIEGIDLCAFDSDVPGEMTVYFDRRFDRADIVAAITGLLENLYDYLAEQDWGLIHDKNEDEAQAEQDAHYDEGPVS